MSCCTFCSNKVEKLFGSLKHDIGKLCVACYMKLHGSCGVCSQSLLPFEPLPDVTYQIQAKFICMGDKSFIVCSSCYNVARQQFPQMFA